MDNLLPILIMGGAMKRSKRIYEVFFVSVVSLLITFGSFSCGAKDSDVPKAGKKTKYTAVDYFDVNYPKIIRINDREYAYINENVNWVHELYLKKNYAAVQKHASELLNSTDVEDSIKLTQLYRALAEITDDKHIDLMHNVLNEWCNKEPNSHIPPLVRGAFYIIWGWSIRGTDYAKNVPKQAWPIFYEKLEMAKKDLDRSFELNPNDPNSSHLLLTVARGLSYQEDICERYYQNGLKACPWHLGLHFERLEGLKRKWGSSTEEMFEFAKACLKQSKEYPFLGLVMADAYREQWEETDRKENILARDDVWPQIEGIYNAIIDRYPNNLFVRYSYAKKAFIAKKYDIALRQFDAVGDRWMERTGWESLERYNANRSYTFFEIGYDLLFRKRQYKESIAYFEKAIRCKPTSYAYYSLGEAYAMLGATPRDRALLLKAEDAYKKAVELDPKDDKAKRMVGMINAMLRSPQ